MKTVVITGSARGFGYALAEVFRANDFNIVLCDISEKELRLAKEKIERTESCGKVITHYVDVTKEETITKLIDDTLECFPTIDIWINNAGINQPNKPIWELDKSSIDKLIEVDLKGTILCSKLIMPIMIKQASGQIYNVEGYGSNDAVSLGLSLYGTSKRAVTYFTEALAKECEVMKTNVLIGKITPGIMITDFITTSLGNGEKIELDEKTKKVYNILGDYPETIACFMVDKIINNKKNGVKFTWLTNFRATIRFMTSAFNKRDFFSVKED